MKYFFFLFLSLSMTPFNVFGDSKELSPSQSLVIRLEDSHLSVARKIKLINAFEQLGFHLSVMDVEHLLGTFETMNHIGEEDTLADRMIPFLVNSIVHLQGTFTQKERLSCLKIIDSLLKKYANNQFECFDKVVQLYYALSQKTLFEKESTLMSSYVIELDNEKLLVYYLKHKRYGLFASMLGISTQLLQPEAYDYLNKKLFYSNNHELRRLLMDLYLQYDSLIYSFSDNEIKKFISYLIKEHMVPIEKALSVYAKLFHTHVDEADVLSTLNHVEKCGGLWAYTISLIKEGKNINYDQSFEYLSYHILLGDRDKSFNRIRDYESLLPYSERHKKSFFCWYIGMSILSSDYKIIHQVFNFALHSLESMDIHNYGNLWLLSYAFYCKKTIIPEKEQNKYKLLIYQELEKKQKNEDLILLSNCYKYLGYNKKAATFIIDALRTQKQLTSVHVSAYLSELESLTGENHGIDLNAWAKTINAMPNPGNCNSKNLQ